MRLVDEVTERPAAPALPAPSGWPAVTGLHPPRPIGHVYEWPNLPRLPPSIPKAPAAVTGPVATTLEAAALEFANSAPTTNTPPKRRHKVLIALGILIAVTLTTAVAFRNSAFVERFTGNGYDTNPLPLHGFPQPEFAGAQYTLGFQDVAVVDGLPTNYWYTGHVEVDYTTNTAKHTFEPAKATIIGGKIGVPVAITPPREFYVDQQASYTSGATPADPWQLTAHRPDSKLTTVLRRDEIPMFQDVIDQALRSQTPTSVVDETRNDVAVTTYAYSFAFGDFYESAPRLFESVSLIDGNAADDARITVTVSLDEQWLVR
ncbi:MAG: hypothetical protein M3P52_13110, partial [Actinomycetota bacterium]|nr:hypothetical protein [Actinomycetota bacterium]